MPQLMPLLWILSNFTMVVILLVMVMIYSANYYNYKSSTKCNKNFCMDWWW